MVVAKCFEINKTIFFSKCVAAAPAVSSSRNETLFSSVFLLLLPPLSQCADRESQGIIDRMTRREGLRHLISLRREQRERNVIAYQNLADSRAYKGGPGTGRGRY